MENNTPPNKLDETIKDNLSNYDAKYDSGDWARMERMLDATPKSIVKTGSYNMALIIGGVILVGGFVIYKGISSSKTTTENTTETPVTTPEPKTEIISKPVPAPVVTNTVTTAPIVTEAPVVVPEVKTVVPETKNTVATVDTKEKTIAEKKVTEKKSKKNDNDINKTQKVTVMGNEPIFGDMIDSSKGIVRETKEKESTKKAAVTKGTSGNVGLSGLLNLNADSIRKQKEQLQKDSLPK